MRACSLCPCLLQYFLVLSISRFPKHLLWEWRDLRTLASRVTCSFPSVFGTATCSAPSADLARKVSRHAV